MGKLDIKIENVNSVTKITLSGIIDEDADLSPFNLGGKTAIDLHLEEVKGINSCGIREWIKWIETAGNTPLSFYNCHKIIVDQINMIQGFLPNHAKVMSFYVLYYSDETGDEKEVLFTHGVNYNEEKGVFSTPEVKDDSQNIMEMDVAPAKYFKFLKGS